MNIGFIGTGSMGSMLISSLIRSQAVLPQQIWAANRTTTKVKTLAEKYPGLQVAESNAEVAKSCDILFLCVKPKEYRTALLDVAPIMTKDQVLITITSPVQVSELEGLVPSSVMRVIPSITNQALSGLVLVEYGESMGEKSKEMVIPLLSHLGLPVEIQQPYLRISADISSCGPAFISYVLQQFITSACDETGLPEDTATSLTTQMIIGLGELLKQGHFSLPELQQRVCVPGGVTGEGLRVLEGNIPGVFHRVFRSTQERFAEDQLEMANQLRSK
ncbi:late competence protein ComER [Brevibacillus daliensis]|uniref:late competence protein ComER n=1 Tax=Brevibacillus daliensis TaxID=2892995 RepID=UPI001E449730|nr:late competence protein ComER [Brevibacillus daliensis]